MCLPLLRGVSVYVSTTTAWSECVCVQSVRLVARIEQVHGCVCGWVSVSVYLHRINTCDDARNTGARSIHHIHTYMMYMHAFMHAYMHSYIHTYIFTCIHTFTCMLTMHISYTHIHTYIYRHMHTRGES
jgi:hypothetical protein